MPASKRSNRDRPGAGRQGDAHPWWLTLGLLVFSALAFIVAFPPYDLWPLIIIAPAAMTWAAIHARTTRRAILLTLLTQSLMWLWVQQWMMEVTAAGYPLLAIALASFTLLHVWIVRRVHVRGGVIATAVPWTILLPVIWTGTEFFRGSVAFDGYPWYLIGLPWVEAPILAQSADLFSVYFTTFLCAMAGGALVDAIEHSRRRRFLIASTALAVILLVANIVYGGWRLGQTDALRPGPGVLAIQTNLPQSNKMKWSLDDQVKSYLEFEQLTRDALASAAAAGDPPDLIVWPETMLPGLGLEPSTIALLRANGHPGAAFADAIVALMRDLGTPILVGSPSYIGLRIENQQFIWDEHFNSAYLITGEAPFQRYDKLFLTPFGETMPYISNWDWLEERLLAIGASGMRFNLDAGRVLTRIEVDTSVGPMTIATPICFEDTVPSVCRRLVWADGEKVTDILINLSNDGWFGAYDDGRLQHVQAARFRAIENRVPLIRAANTGRTVHIDSSGRVVDSASSGRKDLLRAAGWMESRVQLDGRLPLFGRVGTLFAWVCLAATIVLLALTFVIRSAPTLDGEAG